MIIRSENEIIPSEGTLKEDNACKIFLKIPAKTHHEITIDDHEKLTLLKQNNEYFFDGVFWDHESNFETPFFRNVFHNNICKVLQGFDCAFILGETSTKSVKSLDFHSFLLENLDILRKIFQDLKGNHITYLIKSSFFVSQEKKIVKDFFEEIDDMKNQDEVIQSPTDRYFVDCNEMINLVSYKLSNNDVTRMLTPPFQFCFRMEIFLYNSQEKICWKGKWIFLDHCSKPLSLNPIFDFLNEKIEECTFPDFIFGEAKNSFVNIYFKYNEVTSECLSYDCDQLNKIGKKIIQNTPKQNPCNNVHEYISMVIDLQKRACVKDYELYNKNMNLFLKEKELDECKLKIAQLESSLHYQEEKLQNVSIVDQNFDEDDTQNKEIQEDEGPPERTQTIVGEESLPKIFRSISHMVGNSLHHALWNKAFSSVNAFPEIEKLGQDNKDEIQFEGKNKNGGGTYEQLLEINYYEELTMLRAKFQKVNKELVKKSCENEKMLKLIEKLKEQHTVFNNLNEVEEEKKIEYMEKDSLLEIVKKQETEIKSLKKMLWENEKIKQYYHSDILKYYMGDAEKIKDIIMEKIKEIIEEDNKEKKEMISREIQKFLEIMFKQYYQKAKTNDELLKELNEMYLYYCRKVSHIRKK